MQLAQVQYYLQVQSRELNKQGKMLAGAYAICHLDGFTGDEYPEGVALRPLNYKGEKQIMMIRGNRKVVQHLGTRHARQKKFLAVCVRPIFKAYQDYQQMANFLVCWAKFTELSVKDPCRAASSVPFAAFKREPSRPSAPYPRRAQLPPFES